MPVKSNIQADFSRAAENYEVHAGLQKEVAESLIKFTDKVFDPILDLGSGTGFLRSILNKEITQTDIAFPMCRESMKNGSPTINSDVEALPFKNASFNTVVSSLTFQWLDDLSIVFDEANRILKPRGIIAFSTLCNGTLHELADSFEKYGEGERINKFSSAENVKKCLEKYFITKKYSSENIIKEYADVFDLQKRIRAIGARKKGKRNYLNKEKAAAINEYYKKNYPSAKGIKATWKVDYFLAIKP